MSGLTRDGTAKPVSRDHILRRERGQGNINFPSSVDHDKDWQPYPVRTLLKVLTYSIHRCLLLTVKLREYPLNTTV